MNTLVFSRGSSRSKILRMSIWMLPMTAPSASNTSSSGTPAGRGSSIRVCSVSVNLAASAGSVSAAIRTQGATHRRSRRRRPRIAAIMPLKTGEFDPLQGGVVGLAGTDTNYPDNVGDEYFAVAHLAGLRSAHARLQNLIHQFVLHGHFYARLRHEIDDVFRSAIQLGVATLATEAFDLGDGHSRHPNFRKCRAHIVQLEGFDDGSDQFHTGTPLQHWGAETILLLFCAAGTTICAGRLPR